MSDTTPGWYPDPRNPANFERWHDSLRWTDHVRPRLDVLTQTRQQPKHQRAKSQKVIDRGLSGTAHTFWLITTICTFGIGSFGWFLHWLFRQIVPRHVRTIR